MRGLVVFAVVMAVASASPVAQGGQLVYTRDNSFEHGVRDYSLEFLRTAPSGVAATFRSGAGAPTAFRSGFFKNAFKTGSFPYSFDLDSPEDLAQYYYLNQNNKPQTRSDRVDTLKQVLNTGIVDISSDDLYRNPALRTAIQQGDGELFVNHSGELFYRPAAPGHQQPQEAGTGVQVAKK